MIKITLWQRHVFLQSTRSGSILHKENIKGPNLINLCGVITTSRCELNKDIIPMNQRWSSLSKPRNLHRQKLIVPLPHRYGFHVISPHVFLKVEVRDKEIKETKISKFS